MNYLKLHDDVGDTVRRVTRLNRVTTLPQRARLVTRLGWHDSAFLLPEQQVGAHSEHLHFYEAGSQLPPISEAGTLEQWQEQIGALCVGNHRLAFVVGVALAGPLLHMLGHE